MYGQGYPPPATPPQRQGVPASVIVLRVLFTLLPLFSIGFLTWATALRIALLTRRVIDWILFGVSIVVLGACIVLMPEGEDIETTQADIVVATILLTAAAFTAYYLVVDIRHDRIRLRGPVPPPAPYNPYAPTMPRHQHQVPQQSQQAKQPQQGYGFPPVQPQPTPQPQPLTPPSPRIDQVRAELDELSDLLRKDPRDGSR
ncbi:hypothetical protein [Streptomyces sp. NPDC048623]|uniref:hypothetical protein n=1 Tax=Streptomyces sp. NPDC048623 TaxID=3155761 RepID=UPI003446AADE